MINNLITTMMKKGILFSIEQPATSVSVISDIAVSKSFEQVVPAYSLTVIRISARK